MGADEIRLNPKYTRVRIAVPGSAITHLPIYLAHELGYDSQEGVEITTENFPGGSKALQALMGGSVDITAGFLSKLCRWLLRDGACGIFLTLLDRPGFVLAVSPASRRKILRVQDLRGTVLGVSTPGSASHNFLSYILIRNGVRPEEVSCTGIGLGLGSAAAFERGHVDAAVLTGAAVAMLQQRIPNLTVLADTRTPEGARLLFGTDVYPSHGLVAPDAWLRANPVTARNVAVAVNDARKWMAGHSPVEIYARMPARYHSLDRDADLEALRITKTMLSQDGTISAQGAETHLDWYQEAMPSELDVPYGQTIAPARGRCPGKERLAGHE